MRAQDMTESQKREEIVTDIFLNMFVEAGAGAGKTTLIVSRIVHLLECNVKPEEIVVITFTNAAAEELRERIIGAVREKGLESALNELDRMNISTIHSFCNVLLKEQGLVNRLPVDLTLLEEGENARQQKFFLNQYLRTLHELDWKQLEDYAGKNVTRKIIWDHIADFYMQIADLPEDTELDTVQKSSFIPYADIDAKIREITDGKENEPSMEKCILSAVEECINQEKNKNRFRVPEKLSALLALDEIKKKDGSLVLFSTSGKAVIQELQTLAADPQNNEARSKLILLVADMVSEKPKSLLTKTGVPVLFDKDRIAEVDMTLREKICGRISDEMKRSLQEYASIAKDESVLICDAAKIVSDREQYYRLAWDHAKKAREYYRRESPRRNVTNDRLLEYTRDLICNKDDDRAFRFFAKKYKCFFVDEFQDTDRLQESFIFRLACDPEHPKKLRPGALFMVGDPKQSIYRFRGAQPEVYFDVKRRFEEAGDTAKVYELQNNFRSSQKVIDWVNEKFTEADSVAPIVNGGYSYQKMTFPEGKEDCAAEAGSRAVLQGIYHCGRADAVHDEGLQTFQLKTKVTTIKHNYSYNATMQQDDVLEVVQLILNLTKKKEDGIPYYYITDYDSKRKPFLREIRFRDFLLLSAEKKNMECYVKEMQKYGIPVILDGKENLSEIRALRVFIRIYHYLVNPKDPFFRIGAEEAMRVTFSAEDEAQLEEISDHVLDCLYEDAKGMTPYGKAMYLERQFSVLFDKNTGISPLTAQKAQSVIRQMIEAVFATEGLDGIAMAEKMREYVDTGIEHELPLAPDTDAVRFMNLHKSKGLEGNIVILLDRRGKKKTISPVSYRSGLKYYPGVKGWSSLAGSDELLEEAKKEGAAEFHRLEYVALTRAKQAFIFMGTILHGGLFATKKIGAKKQITDKDGVKHSVCDKLDESTFSYQIDDSSVDVRTKLKELLGEERMKNEPAAKAGTAEEYDPKTDDYPKVFEQGGICQTSFAATSPSLLEKSTNKIIVREKAAAESKSRYRPKGNTIGNILHRAMELLVGKRFSIVQMGGSQSEDSAFAGLLEECCEQAIEENKADLLPAWQKEGASTDEMLGKVKHFILSCEVAYADFLEDKWGDISEVYPEVHFSYMMDGELPGSVNDNLKKRGITSRNVWMNGTADLIYKKKNGNYCLIDYKSDNDLGVTEEDMESYLKEKYMPQLQVYQSVIKDILGVPADRIETGLISFSQKDEQGMDLGEGKVRVRYTTIN